MTPGPHSRRGKWILVAWRPTGCTSLPAAKTPFHNTPSRPAPYFSDSTRPPTAALRELHFTPRHLAVTHQPTNGEKLAGKARLWGVRAQRRRGADSTAEGAGEPRSAGPPDARAQGPPPCRVARRQVVSQGRQPRPSKKQTLPDFRGSAVSSLL